MTDRKHVILDSGFIPDACKNCTKFRTKICGTDEAYCMKSMLSNTLAILREQESIFVHDPGAICPNCKWPLYPEDHPHYCGNCGRKVKWDADN